LSIQIQFTDLALLRFESADREFVPAIERLAFVDLPIAFRMKSHLQEAVFWIVALAAAGTTEIATPGRALAVIIFGHREGGAATARDQEHPKRSVFFSLS